MKGLNNMNNKELKHNKNWSDFKNTLDLSKDELTEIDFKVELVGKIIQLRKELGLTQSELAERCNIKQEYLARLERSKSAPQIDTLLKILVPLGYKLDIVPLQ